MASIADLLITGQQRMNEQPGPIEKGTEAFTKQYNKVAEIALAKEQNLQNQQKLAQAKQDLEMKRLDGYFGAIETGYKIPEKNQRTYFKDVLPQRAMAYGIDMEKLHPAVNKALVESPDTLRAFAGALNAIRTNQKKADGTAVMSPEDTTIFFQSTADPEAFYNYLPVLLDAQKEKIALEAKAKNALVMNADKTNTRIDEMRKELTAHPISKLSITVDAAYKQVASAFKKAPSPAGDLSGIFAYMKMLDPNSGVKEGEFSNAEKSAAWSDQLWQLYGKATRGERLTPEQRKDFLSQATKLRINQQNAQDQINAQFMALAESRGFDPKLVLAGLDMRRVTEDPVQQKVPTIIRVGDRDINVDELKAQIPQVKDIKKFVDELSVKSGKTVEEVRKLLGIK